MDVFIGGHANVHGTDHKRNTPVWQLFEDLSSYHFCCIKSMHSSTKYLFGSKLVLDCLRLPVPQDPVCSV